MIAVLLSSFAAAMAAPWIARWRSGRGAWLLVLVPAALTAYFASLAHRVAGGAVPVDVHRWVPALGVELTLRFDGLSSIFTLLISALGALVVAYSARYLQHARHRDRFFAYLILFMSAMLGIVLADHLLAVYVFWELTTIASFLLIGFESVKEDARRAAQQSLLVTVLGGLAMLAGFVLLSMAAGNTFRISEIVARAGAVQAHGLYTPALVLIALGAFTKSAQVPFHFWLPSAMAAPTPVSAYLHSATMVKAGIYLLARLAPALGGTVLWFALLTTAGAVTAVLGAVLALRSTDMKRVLAYSTVAMLGMLTYLVGVGTERAVQAAVVLLVAHALYKGALFLCVGSVDHEAGSRDVSRLGGLARSMPVTAAAAALAGASMAGLPPLLGFAFKELTYAASLELEVARVVLMSCVVLSNALTVVAAAVIAARPFWGRAASPEIHVHEAPWAMWLPPVLLGGAGLVVGVLPGPVERLVLDPAVSAILGRPATAEVTTVPHWSPELLLSAVTVLAGVIGYLRWDQIRAWLATIERASAIGPERAYDRAVTALQRVAVWQTRVLQHGYLRYYLLTVAATYVVLAIGAMAISGLPVTLPAPRPDATLYEWLLMGLAAAAAIAAVLARSRLTAIMVLALLGFAVALLFLIAGAIDLAMTQFLVETLIIVILQQVMRTLPALEPLGRLRPSAQALNLALSLGLGALVTMLLIGVLQQPFDRSVSEYYMQASAPQGHGRNVVNVILVDFRALDTLGEIAVIATAVFGAWAMLRADSATGSRKSP